MGFLLDIVNGTTLLDLFREAQLKLMTKVQKRPFNMTIWSNEPCWFQMDLQVVSLFGGLPTMPLNLTGRDGWRVGGMPPDYHPLFERFSNLFIPLIVLAAVCAFVAIITVVCLVKRSHTFSREQLEFHQKEKFLRPWVITIGFSIFSISFMRITNYHFFVQSYIGNWWSGEPYCRPYDDGM